MVRKNETNESLQKLADFISDKTDSEIITRPSLERVIHENQKEILQLLAPILEELPATMNEKSLMDTVWGMLYEKDHIFTNMNSDFQLIRDVVTSPNNFNQQQDNRNKSELIDSRGIIRGMAEVRLAADDMNPNEFNPLWIQLVEQTLSSLDEFTADLFDLISYLWVVSPKNSHGYIDFESDYALRLRYSDPTKEDFKIRERERFSIMRRVAALSSIWICMRDDNVTVINTDSLLDEDRKNYDFQTFTRMFDITALKMAYDRTSGDAKGIYSLQIRPTPVIERYLTKSTQTFGPLDMKVFKFHHITQREHKRLTRFLNYQWKIRAIQRTVARPFKVETLVNVMKFAARTRLNTRMDTFRTVLNDLVENGVIKDWYYEEEFDETKLLKRGGQKIWLAQNVYISPPDALAALNKEKTLVQDVQLAFKQKESKEELLNATEQLSMYIEQQPALTASEKNIKQEKVKPLSNEEQVQVVATYMQANKIPLRTVSAATGISAATLMRYVNGSVKKMKQPTLDALFVWYEEQQNKTEL